MGDSGALRALRHRQHRNGDHSLCSPGRCPAIAPLSEAAPEPTKAPLARPSGPPVRMPVISGEVDGLRAAVEAEFPPGDELSRQIALRLVDLAGGGGPASVQAVRALGELVAAQRDPR